MREIIFRGFRNFEGNALYPPDKRWIYGYYYFQDGKHWIKDMNDMKMSYVVEDGSVGQYIGQKDKNVIKIYEGDILHNEFDRDKNHAVIWSDYNSCWALGDEDSFPLWKYALNEFWEIIENETHQNKTNQ